MSLALGAQRDCEACGERLVGAAKPGERKVAPITVAPKETGNVLLWRDPDGTPRYAIVGHERTREYLRALDVPLRLNHFADCPKARRFRR